MSFLEFVSVTFDHYAAAIKKLLNSPLKGK